ALLRRVREDPADDDARLVYADAILERGDPRGELIVLQQRTASGEASDAERTRARALIREHREAWLGPPALLLRQVVFERGCLARAELGENDAAAPSVWKQAAADERLATVVELRKGRGKAEQYRAFLMSPWTRGLQAIDIPIPSMLDALMGGDARPIRQLSFA